jgi:hypothetical protein
MNMFMPPFNWIQNLKKKSIKYKQQINFKIIGEFVFFHTFTLEVSCILMIIGKRWKFTITF